MLIVSWSFNIQQLFPSLSASLFGPGYCRREIVVGLFVMLHALSHRNYGKVARVLIVDQTLLN
jgi:hypothetical protein